MVRIEKNTEHNGIELYFEGKPSEETRSTLKANGYRWHGLKKCWYAKDTEARQKVAEAIANGQEVPQATPAPVKVSEVYKADKETLRAEYAKEWNDPKMIDYCTNKATHMVKLSDGGILPIERRSIETRFCFGESGYDFKEAADMAHHARTNEDYFRSENLKEFDEQIKDITEQIEEGTTNHYFITIGKHKESNICFMRYLRISEVLDARGGSAYLGELAGENLEIYGITYRIPTTEELTDMLAAYKEARAKHAKRVETYLKKYGLSKVHSWTYWRDR